MPADSPYLFLPLLGTLGHLLFQVVHVTGCVQVRSARYLVIQEPAEARFP